MNQIRRLHWSYESNKQAGWINVGPNEWHVLVKTLSDTPYKLVLI